MSADSESPKPKPEAAQGEKQPEKFFDAKFSIEAIQNEPYEDGFTWRTVLGAFFISFVMLPGLIFMGLMIGQDLGTAAEWVTIILFVEVARRAFITLKKQELYILKYTAAQLTHLAGGMTLGGGMFAYLVWNRYMRNSEAFYSFGITYEVPDWVAPLGDLAYQPFWAEAWWPVTVVTIIGALLSKLTQLSLGWIAFKATSDMEKLPFPLAPIHAEGAIALAETSQDKNKRGYRQYCFATGVVLGAAFGILYVAIPIISGAFLPSPLTPLAIPFYDFTTTFENLLPAGTIGISANLGLLMIGFVLPFRIVVGMITATILFQIVLNPIFYRLGWLPSWEPGKDAIATHVSNSVDLYLSVGIGTALAIAVVGFYGIGKAVAKYNRKKKEKKQGLVETKDDSGEFDLKAFWRRDKARGDPPFWAALGVWIFASVSIVFFCDYLINMGFEGDERFPIYWLLGFAFFWTPLNTYINARMSGIAGQHAGIPFVAEAGILASRFRGVSIWFAPLPINNFGSMADMLKETQLTRTRFTSILKAEMLVFPLLIFASFIFWSYIDGLGPIPSDDYPYAQKFWPQFAQMRALFASSMQEGDSLLFEALKPGVIGGVLVGTVALFGAFGALGISSQYLYGGLGALTQYPHNAVLLFVGALLGRYFFSRKFGKDKWTNYTPILAVGFGAGMGLIGMFSIAINFLWTSIGTGY